MNVLVVFADAAAAGAQAAQDGLSTGNWVLVAAGGAAIVVPLVLKALGKDLPIVDPIVEGLLQLARKIPAPKGAPVDPAKKERELRMIAGAVADAEKKQDKLS